VHVTQSYALSVRNRPGKMSYAVPSGLEEKRRAMRDPPSVVAPGARKRPMP